ncbi:MAG: SDR family NAD(P)-dependent oxidoreductase [Muribaculaceae bacterium]|nr:SDR family NAD(P)-dependent oxidoreductase [Muribaculaceae bacterium]
MKKTIVVIGAGPGLGYGVAKKFGKEGYFVILVARNQESLVKMSDELNMENIDNTFAIGDSSEDKKFKEVLEGIKSEFGTPDVVVYNVGITAPDPENLTTEDLVYHFKTDVAGAWTTIEVFTNDEFATKKGAIIFTGGGLALYPADGFIPLSIDKAALRSMAYILNNKFKEKGIFVGTVTVCGSINGDKYFSADNIAEMYWQMNEKRDKVEYAYEYPEVAPSKFYEDQKVKYGIFEENSGKFWGEVYKILADHNKQ